MHPPVKVVLRCAAVPKRDAAVKSRATCPGKLHFQKSTIVFTDEEQGRFGQLVVMGRERLRYGVACE